MPAVTYYLPYLLTREDYAVMATRFSRIIKAIPEFTGECEWRKDTRKIIRYRSDKLLVVLCRKNDHRERYEIHIECDGRKDIFFVFDYNTEHEFTYEFVKALRVEPIGSVAVKSELLDFIDDYCTNDTVDVRK